MVFEVFCFLGFGQNAIFLGSFDVGVFLLFFGFCAWFYWFCFMMFSCCSVVIMVPFLLLLRVLVDWGLVKMQSVLVSSDVGNKWVYVVLLICRVINCEVRFCFFMFLGCLICSYGSFLVVFKGSCFLGLIKILSLLVL